MTISNFNSINLGQQGAFESLTTPVIADGAVTAQKIGTLASAIIQDITYTAATGGTSGNSISITYIESVLPGYETVEVSDNAITVNIGNSTFSIVEIVDATHLEVSATAGMQVGDTITQGLSTTTIISITNVSELQVASTSGFVIGNATDLGLLSTATQVLTAIQNSYLASVLVTTVITGTPSNKQVGVSTTSLSGGIGSALVTSIHSDSNPDLIGNVQFVSGTHVTLSQSGNAITINATGELSTTLTSSHIFVGNGSNIATDTAMTGDVSITNAGVTTVGSVGGSSAANIHSAELAANAATNLDTPSTIVARDSSGNFNAGIITASLTGHASLDLALTGGILTGSLGIGESPVSSAILDVASITQGFLPPRMTTIQRIAISSPAEGLQVYDLTVHQLYQWNGSSWVILG